MARSTALPTMEAMIVKLAQSCFRHRWRTLTVWIVGLVAVIALGSAFAGPFSGGGRLTGTDSDRAYRILDEKMPSTDVDREVMVFAAAPGQRLDAQRDEIATFIRRIDAITNVEQPSTPFDEGSMISADGRIGQASFEYGGSNDDQQTTVDAIVKEANAFNTQNDNRVRVEFASGAFSEGGLDGSGEIIGIAAAVVILLLAFGSIIAMGVPIVTALIGVAIGVSSLGLWARFVNTPEFTTQVAVMVGLGVGIDYALFIITRYRHALAFGASPSEALDEAIGTAGRAVVFAGSIVMVSLLGMILIGLPFLHGLAIGTATTVLVAVLAAITLLPALLSLMGRRVGARAKRRAVSTKETLWHRWGRLVQRRAVGFAIGGTAVLSALVLPVAWMHLASADHGNDAKGSTTREAYELLSSGFGKGVNGPLVIAAATPDAASRNALAALESSLASTKGVAAVLGVSPNADNTAAAITLIPTTGPQDGATASLVHRLRNDVIPASARGTALEAHVGGQTASDIDFAQIMSSRLPIFMGSVLAFSFVLLMLVFGSLLVPLKAVILNLLSIGAAYGAMVAVFQWGWFGSLLGVSGGAPIEPWAPMMLFAIVFGLSMDYEVFLLTAIKERFDHTGNNREAVIDGLASTARVITAAAAIMVMVFGGFLTNGDRSIKMIGFGLAAAVFIDATLVRMLLVPATMELLGARNWWMPKWLRRVLPKVSLEAPSVRPLAQL
jgi:putative drug exporter of the RND superfamily